MAYRALQNRYDKMIYRRCGRSGLMLPVISLGLWHNFGFDDDFGKCKRTIFRAFDLGITHFDLANNYGPPPGSAETNFGKIFKKNLKNYRDEIIISTKAGYWMWPGPYGEWGSKKYLISSLDQSLKRMGLDYVDIYYSHCFDPSTPLEETIGALCDAVHQGKALYSGISNYNREQTIEALKIFKQHGISCLIHQDSYSMFNRFIETELLEHLSVEGMGCIAFSPLNQGILTDRYLNGIPNGSRASKAHFLKPEHITEDKLNKVRKLREIAKERGQSMAQFALAWVLRNKGMTSALIGASSPVQIEDNVKVIGNLSFTSEELKKTDKILG